MLKMLVFLIAAFAFGYFAYTNFDDAFGPREEERSVACTLEAKICSDGSAVGRTGPNCEFEACPGE